jgi:glycine cleavage system aminomethyltransferase T
MERLLDLDSEREFIGKKALLGIREAGIKRRIAGVELFCEPLQQGSFSERWPVLVDEKIGEVLIALHSPRLEKNIGYAMISAFATAGKEHWLCHDFDRVFEPRYHADRRIADRHDDCKSCGDAFRQTC